MNQAATLIVSASPHITKKGNTTRRIMLDVIIALSPAVIAAVLFFGHLALLNVIYCVLFCMGFELLYNMLISKKWNKEGVKNNSVWDFSSMVTGIILALNLPTHITIGNDNVGKLGINPTAANGMVMFSLDALIMCFLGSLVAIVVVKMLFGGIGKNFANPAAVGRIFLFLAFSLPAVSNVFLSKAWVPDAVTSATYLSRAANTETYSPLYMLFGLRNSAAVGETCVIALLLGYIYLSVRKVIDFRLPLMVVASAAVFTLLFQLKDVINKSMDAKALFDSVLMHILSGGLIFGAIFMATDYSTSPNTFKGSAVYAVGIGLVTMLIRFWASAPEGVSFAIVIMNIFVPVIDKYIRNKPFGHVKNKGKSTIEAKNKSVETGPAIIAAGLKETAKIDGNTKPDANIVKTDENAVKTDRSAAKTGRSTGKSGGNSVKSSSAVKTGSTVKANTSKAVNTAKNSSPKKEGQDGEKTDGGAK